MLQEHDSRPGWFRRLRVRVLGIDPRQQASRTDALENHVGGLEQHAADLDLRSATFAERLAVIAEQISALTEEKALLLRQQAEMGTRLDALEAYVASEQSFNPTPRFDYVGFENRFRGSEELIRERQQAYLDCFPPGGTVLDIGCGRGEFLELLRNTGRQPLGLDLNPDMAAYCCSKGFDVAHDHALAYLLRCEDESLDGIFAAQVIEHVSFGYATQWVETAFRKLRPGGALIMETVNPHCPEAMAWFHLDPTHIRPIYPEYLQFLFESKGFSDVHPRYTTVASYAQDRPETERGPHDFGDYAMIGVKPTA